MNTASTSATTEAEAARDRMIARLRELGALHSPAVAEAFRSVPRHAFTCDAALDQAYAAETSVVTKRDAAGAALSSVSAPRVQALMLEQAGVEAGMRCLEIGSGGYNAALLAELVGTDGEVTTLDIDAEITGRARRLLDEAGYTRVNVVCADGDAGAPAHAPFDRIIATAGAWDIPPAWIDQLTPGGRIVVPLRVRGLTRSVVFEREGDRLVSRDLQSCGFVPMLGAGAHPVRLAALHEDGDAAVALRLDEDERVDTGLLSAALASPPAAVWSGVEIGGEEPFDGLDLWLACTSGPAFALMVATKAARAAGLVASASPVGVAALVDGASFAYRTVRPAQAADAYEFGARAHGPDGSSLAARLADRIREWDRGHRHGPGPVLQVHPAGTPDDRLPSSDLVVDKTHTRITISWP
ncbi:methyltransferase, FxLD system [Nocardiopsis trehalosi]|uniref:methyltransferase, FxLD system n=1 Tax=Nocardiopsis trehalosi TaxID=109329 RepID=UPI0008367604|nr:methyltransferase, FxLD system [Nocardiopsis trehalosi]